MKINKKRGPKSISLNEINLWLTQNNFLEKYEIIDFQEGSTYKITFLDKTRNILFKKRWGDFRRDLTGRPDRIFHPNKEEKQAIQITALEKRYGPGTTSPFSIPKVRERAKNTIKQLCGEDNVFKTKEYQNKAKASMIENWGTDNIFRTKEVHENRNKEEVEKIRDKRKKTNISRWGVEYAASSPAIREKIRETNMTRWGGPSPSSSQSVTQKGINTKVKNGTLILYQGKTKRQWAKEKVISASHFGHIVNTQGWDKAVEYELTQSDLEYALENIIKEITTDYKAEVVIGNYRADFVINSHKIAIEADSFKWHNDAIYADSKYHFKKKNKYKEMGYESLFFRQNEILFKRDIVKSVIKNKMKLNEIKIGGRQCEVSLIDTKIGNKFLNDNHLMGRGYGVHYGLIFKGELVSIIQIRTLKNETREVEVSRFCNRIETTIPGAFSKLIQYVIFQECPGSITTYIDQRYGSGSYLENLGWKFISNNISFKWTDCRNRTFGWRQFLDGSGYDIGLKKIYDCGQAKWKLSF